MTTPPATRRGLRLEWWHYVATVFLAIEVLLAAVPRLRPGKLGMFCWYFGMDLYLWGGLAGLILILALLWSLWRRPVWRRSRVLGVGLLVVMAAMPFTYATYPSGNANYRSKIRFRVPFDGPVTIGWGGNTSDVNYHVVAPDQRWAYDILMQGEDGKTYRGDREKVENYLIYDKPVLAPAAGIVIDAVDGLPNTQINGSDVFNPSGNHVDLGVAPGEVLHLAHLKPGSVRVKAGDRVSAGQEIGRVGNSGNTSEPHLHIHLQDGPGDLREGLPLSFSGYRSGGRFVERGMPQGGLELVGDDLKLVGETIEHVDAEDPAKADTP